MSESDTRASPDTSPADGSDVVLTRAEALMRRHKGVEEPRARAPAAAVTPGSDAIPTLTDLVSAGTRRPAPTPRPDAVAPAVTREQARELEDEVYDRLQDRLDHEIGALLERRVMPELSGSLDYALEHIARELKGSVRQMVREAIEETLNRHVRNKQLPLAARDDETPPEAH